ncbi:hypothetical protein EV421DRAFT_2024311 [Armillaria borealis]|uniref:Uncharacterized protein n=1 Tax=Armillaria borealis TaxID=47425 RepID=A0AA39IZS6_9AGAR|nr:hypothetical protein EV421DRAFT_2024311 [Armillaria borealis]
MHTIGLTWIMEDLSASLLPWCANAHTVRISSGNVRNTAIIPSLSVLRDLELSRLTFCVVEDYFKLLANLPPTLKKLAVHGIRFRFGNSGTGCYATVRRGAEVEHLETYLGEDLSVLLRDDCPISLKSLRVAYVPQALPHDLENLVQRTPHFIDLRLDIATPEDRPGFLDERVGIFRRRLGELGMSPNIKFTEKLVPDRIILSSSEPSFSYVRATFCHSRGDLQAGVLNNGRRDIYGRSYLSCRGTADSSGSPASPVQFYGKNNCWEGLFTWAFNYGTGCKFRFHCHVTRYWFLSSILCRTLCRLIILLKVVVVDVPRCKDSDQAPRTTRAQMTFNN